MSFRKLSIPLLCGLLPTALLGAALSETETAADPNVVFASKFFDGLKYRSLGFTRGGRSTAVTGVPSQPLTYYFGSTGGGVWKTTDGGINWSSISDESFQAGSIGAIAVAVSDPNIIYVGTGSACPRGNVSPGIGIYKSMDAGKTWAHVGLPEAGQIGKILVHPEDPNLVYVAALGAIFGPNKDRGVYRSVDGGQSWELVLFVSEETGAVHIAMDMNNPRVLFASMWTVQRKPWTLISGSQEGGIFKSLDGGSKWEKLSGGLPAGLVGKSTVAVSGADSQRVWAIVEADSKGGVYRSEDAGESWKLINAEASLLQRPWYYNHIYADPLDANTVYVLNTRMYKSTDGGKSYERIRTPHGDNHDLWINPSDNQIMVEANDGGANVSFNGGQSWSSQRNQPTAEIYRLTVDHQFPYRVYGAQQDNSTISVPSQGGADVVQDWYSAGGCESGHIAVHPRDPDIVYAGCYGGNISRINRATGESRSILVYPQLQLGQAPRDLKYRFQWNAPIRISPHNPNLVYHTSQVVHLSRNEGQNWQTISPDLTRNDKSRQDYAGEPITHDSTGVEVYGVIFSFEESMHRAGLLWAGSDDGLVHISTDAGENWKEITPASMPEWGTVNTIELSAHDPGRAFLAVHRYREQDFTPYILRTTDYGETWDLLTDGSNGIPRDHFVRVVREDPEKKGLLYAGTEFGMYVSFDDGAHWQSLQLNLPVTPVTDLAVHRGDLVVATQGRAFWILDDISPLRQLDPQVAEAIHYLYRPREGYRWQRGQVNIDYYLGEPPTEEVILEIQDAGGERVADYRGKAEEEDTGSASDEASFFSSQAPKLPVKKGLNRFSWDLRHPRIDIPDGVVVWGGRSGAKVVPGSYQVKLTIGDQSQTQSFSVGLDPRAETTVDDLQEQSELAGKIRQSIEALYDRLKSLRELKMQLEDLTVRLKKADLLDEELEQGSQALMGGASGLERQLTQPKSKSNQDPLNFPPMLDNQLITLYGYVTGSDHRPTSGAYERFDDLTKLLDPLLEKVDGLLRQDLKAFNDLVRKKEIGGVILKTP